ncbi:MAG: alpha/beta hydrolase [Planctomycetota bacterium]
MEGLAGRFDAMMSLPNALDAPRRTFDTRAGGTLSYYLDEDAAGVPLLLLHSVNATPSAIEVKPLFDHYRGQRQVYALELPGFGFSDRSNREYSPELYADALNETVASLPGPIDIVALSTTAEFVARAALAAPEAYRSLVLVSPTGLAHRQPPGEATSDRIDQILRFSLLSSNLYRLLTTRTSIRYFLRQSFSGRMPESLVDYACATARQPGAAYAPYAFLSMRLFTRDAVENLYRDLTIPTLVLYDRDPNIDFERLPELEAANAFVSSVRISPTMGLPHWDEPEATYAAIDRFHGQLHAAGHAESPGSAGA